MNMQSKDFVNGILFGLASMARAGVHPNSISDTILEAGITEEEINRLCELDAYDFNSLADTFLACGYSCVCKENTK